CSEDGTTACSPNSNPNATCEPIDLCGDIDNAPNPIILTDIEITALCADPDGDSNLNLPNCTSWRQPGSNDICTSPLDAFPGAPSKCNCDPGINIEICVPDPCFVSVCANDNSIECECDADCSAVGGSCTKTGNPVDCSAFETDCSTFSCDPGGTAGNCDIETPKPLSTPCEADGDLCTNDHCDGNGSCVLESTVTCNRIDQCTDSVCNPATGMCDPDPDPLSTPCEADGDLCTNDHCDGNGSCVLLSNVTCNRIDQCTDSACNPATGACDPDPDPLSTPCEADGDLCTNDHCDGNGSCVLLSNVTCSRINQCTDSVCNPATGMCDPDPDPLSTPCEREVPPNLCTVDHCNGSGQCVFLSEVMCDPAVGDCEAGERCEPTTGQCEMLDDAPLSTPCEEDGDFCTI
ncbi:MAG: hypothetical protein R3330_16505, partial [Saprospiraceae bacterium]|nr:hypothetical protein [Saprospiraceae bacterium]